MFQLTLVLDEWKVPNVMLGTIKGLEGGSEELSLISMPGKLVDI